MGLITAFFTAFYSFRLLHLTFYGVSRSPRAYLSAAHELTPRMAFALAILAFGSIFIGFLGRDLFVGLGTPFWNGAIHLAPENTGLLVAGEALSTVQKMLPVFGSVVAVSLVFVVYEGCTAQAADYIDSSSRLRGVYRFLTFK